MKTIKFILGLSFIIIIAFIHHKTIDGFNQSKCNKFKQDTNCKTHCALLDNIIPFYHTSTDNNLNTFKTSITNYTNETLHFYC